MDVLTFRFFGFSKRDFLVLGTKAVCFSLAVTLFSFFVLYWSTGVQPRELGLSVMLVQGLSVSIIAVLVFMRFTIRKMYAYIDITMEDDKLELKYKAKEWSVRLEEVIEFQMEGNANKTVFHIMTKQDSIKLIFESNTPEKCIYFGLKRESYSKELSPFITAIGNTFRTYGIVYSWDFKGEKDINYFKIQYQNK